MFPTYPWSQALDQPEIMEHFSNEKNLDDYHVSEGSSEEVPAEQSAINERRLVLKVDLRILPILCVVYLMAFIDRYIAVLHLGYASRPVRVP